MHKFTLPKEDFIGPWGQLQPLTLREQTRARQFGTGSNYVTKQKVVAASIRHIKRQQPSPSFTPSRKRSAVKSGLSLKKYHSGSRTVGQLTRVKLFDAQNIPYRQSEAYRRSLVLTLKKEEVTKTEFVARPLSRLPLSHSLWYLTRE